MRLSLGNSILFLSVLVTDVLGVKAAPCEDKEIHQVKLEMVKASIIKARTLYPKCKDKDEEKNECGKKDKAYAYLDIALELLKTAKCPFCPDPDVRRDNHSVDCSDILKMGHKKSGVYTIWPKSRVNVNKPISVYCDMDTDGGGWTVIHRRGNYSQQTDFYEDWETYKQGFGDLEKDFWLGNDNIFTLTNQGEYSIRLDLTNHQGEYRYSEHNSFWIGDEHSNYILHVKNFTGNVSDNFGRHDGVMFSTTDRQNDMRAANASCVPTYKGGWWYKPTGPCTYLNLNGLYQPGIRKLSSNYLFYWHGPNNTNFVGLLSTEMKIRHT